MIILRGRVERGISDNPLFYLYFFSLSLSFRFDCRFSRVKAPHSRKKGRLNLKKKTTFLETMSEVFTCHWPKRAPKKKKKKDCDQSCNHHHSNNSHARIHTTVWGKREKERKKTRMFPLSHESPWSCDVVFHTLPHPKNPTIPHSTQFSKSKCNHDHNNHRSIMVIWRGLTCLLPCASSPHYRFQKKKRPSPHRNRHLQYLPFLGLFLRAIWETFWWR